MALLLGLLAFCAAGWARTSLRLATARRNEQIWERSYGANEERIRLAEQTAHFGTWAWDPATELFALSEGAAEINGLGNRAVKLTGAELYATVHPDDRDA